MKCYRVYCTFYHFLQECCKRFGNVDMRVASNSEESLYDWYGPHWKTVGESPCYNHENGGQRECVWFNISSSPNLYAPAVPFSIPGPIHRPIWNNKIHHRNTNTP